MKLLAIIQYERPSHRRATAAERRGYVMDRPDCGSCPVRGSSSLVEVSGFSRRSGLDPFPIVFPWTKTSFRVEVDQPSRQIVSQELSNGKVISSTAITASDLNSAEMQFDRGKRTIVLIGRDGQQIFPLGEERLQNEPNQYVILNALRAAIGQTPAAP
jgi:hypothetical protein